MRFAWFSIAAAAVVLIVACNQHATGGSGAGAREDPSSGVGGAGGFGEIGAGTGATNDGGGFACKQGLPCAADEFCDYGICGDGECGSCSEEGVCRKKPTSCAGDAKLPVCACDDKVYDNACEAHLAGVRALTGPGHCHAPAGTFTCGETFCALDAELCEQLSNGDGSISDGCVKKPASCAADDCVCLLDALGASDRCSSCAVAHGGATLQCLGYGT